MQKKKADSKPVWLLVLPVLLAGLAVQGCGKNVKKEPWDVGEVVTWRISDDLVVKGKLGTRRRHIPLSPQGEAALYVPTEWRYMGQFPIDYVPERYPLITAEEARRAMEPGRPLEFDLMLNGSWVVPTDAPYSPQAASSAIDHPDQVRIEYVPRPARIDFNKYPMVDQPIKPYHDYDDLGLSCMVYLDRSDQRGDQYVQCHASSARTVYSWVSMRFYDSMSHTQMHIRKKINGVESEIQMTIGRSNLPQWQQTAAKAWQLIDLWNVAPGRKQF